MHNQVQRICQADYFQNKNPRREAKGSYQGASTSPLIHPCCLRVRTNRNLFVLSNRESFGGHWFSKSACLNGLLLLLFEMWVNVSIIATCIDSQGLADFPNGSVFV